MKHFIDIDTVGMQTTVTNWKKNCYLTNMDGIVPDGCHCRLYRWLKGDRIDVVERVSVFAQINIPKTHYEQWTNGINSFFLDANRVQKRKYTLTLTTITFWKKKKKKQYNFPFVHEFFLTQIAFHTYKQYAICSSHNFWFLWRNDKRITSWCMTTATKRQMGKGNSTHSSLA